LSGIGIGDLQALMGAIGVGQPTRASDAPIITTKGARYKGNPVLTRGGSGAWDEGRVDNPWVVYVGTDHKYKMWYSGRDGNDRNGQIGYAESDDGLSWTKSDSNPVFSDADIPGGYPNGMTEDPKVMVYRTSNGYRYIMIYNQYAFDANWNVKGSVLRVARSSDGINWSKQSATVTGGLDFTVFTENYGFDLRCVWRDRDGWYHMLTGRNDWTVSPGRRKSPFYEYVSDDFVTWRQNPDIIDLRWEIYNGSFEQMVDDLTIVPVREVLSRVCQSHC